MESGEVPQYRVICTMLASLEGEHVRTYGVEMLSCERSEVFSDVSLDADEVHHLVHLLRSERVESCHFRDVVCDTVERLASP